MRTLKRYSLLGTGIVSLVFGVVGIVVPLLPTTPFLLLSAACFARSSDSFYDWLIGHRWFGQYIQSYRSGRGIPLKAKLVTIALLWLSITSSVIFFVDVVWAKIAMLSVAICVSYYLWSRPTLKSDSPG